MKLPQSFYNWTTIAGAVVAVFSAALIIIYMIFSVAFGTGEGYSGLVAYIFLPVFLIIGLLMIPLGAWRKHGRIKKHKEEAGIKFPVLNLNERPQRTAAMVFILGTTIFLLLSAVGSYEAFHYTESVEFCGTMCHTVMKPEHTAFQNSPHARVACVECHVGSGAGWYVKSKLSGLYQVYAVLADVYPTPIPTPISSLRPARETCEECHWPEQFYSRKLQTGKHYLADEANTEWDIMQQIKIGSSYKALGLMEGIHWHINKDVKIEYLPTDKSVEKIPWVRYTNLKTGAVKIFTTSDTVIDPGKIDESMLRTMDCMDCHNRPSHNYHPPQWFIDDAITAGKISKSLPNIKLAALSGMDKDFSTTDSAMNYLRQRIDTYYQENYPDIYSSSKKDVENMILAIQDGFSKNIFPEMKVKWNVYPDHIGHMTSNGCYRCHDEQHATKEGETISRDCNLCHVIVGQGSPDSLQTAPANGFLDFRHPVDIGDAWKEMLCSECHRALY